MEIKEILSQHRNDFTATLVCEHCGHEQKLTSGYDDAFYHDRVLPSLICKACDKDRAGGNRFKDNEHVPSETAAKAGGGT